MSLSLFNVDPWILASIAIIISFILTGFTKRKCTLTLKEDFLALFEIWALSIFSGIFAVWVVVPALMYPFYEDWMKWTWGATMPWCTFIGAIAIFLFTVRLTFRLHRRQQ